MNIEDLSKTQLLLLTLLVNFVTSIATGVLTVSLLQQAPATVVQTVNRIVDHTIETVTTPITVQGPSKAPTSVPSTEDLLTNAIAGASSRAVHLSRGEAGDPVVRGVYVPSLRAVFVYSTLLPHNVNVTFADGTTLLGEEGKSDGPLRQFTFSQDAVLPKAADVKLVPLGDLKQGQTVIALDDNGGAVTGIISRISDGAVVTDLPGVPAGAGVVNLSGNLLGVSRGDGTLSPADLLTALSSAP